jgi:hypothetical protein
MKNVGWLNRIRNQQPSLAMFVGMVVAMFLAAACIAVAQDPSAPAPNAPVSAPDGYVLHQSIDVGGHMNGVSGSGAMYDTLVNQKTGPRVLGQTFELHALSSN